MRTFKPKRVKPRLQECSWGWCEEYYKCKPQLTRLICAGCNQAVCKYCEPHHVCPREEETY